MVDRRAVAREAVVLERHPNLESTETSGLLKTVLANPCQAAHTFGFPVSLQIGWYQAECRAKIPAVAHQHQTSFHRDVQPFMGIQGDAVGERNCRQLARVFWR